MDVLRSGLETARPQQRIEYPAYPHWDIPPAISVGAAISVSSSIGFFVVWKVYDRWIKPKQYGWFAQLKRPYEIIESVGNGLQNIRLQTKCDRSVLMEVDSNRGTMIALAQEVAHAGISKINFSASENKSDCVKKILQRFNDDCFVYRETKSITEAKQYQGFLNNYGIIYVIYYKIGEINNTTWILALHFSCKGEDDYMQAIDLQSKIKQVCSSMFFSLLQQSPVEGLFK